MARTLAVEEAVLQEIDEQPDASTQSMAWQFGILQVTTWGILNDEGLQPFYLPGVQVLAAYDIPSMLCFVSSLCREQLLILIFKQMFFLLMKCFSFEGVLNTHNFHVWAHQNPHKARPAVAQQCLAVNMQTGIVSDCLLCSYLLPSYLDRA